MRNKKGSMELSINSIVVIVLALTMLGLGLSFIKGQVSKMTDTSTNVQQQIAEQIEGQLRTTGEKMSFAREINMGKGKSEVITLGIQNVLNNQLNYKVELLMDCANTDSAVKEAIAEGECPANNDEALIAMPTSNVRYDKGCLSLGLSETITHGISLEAPATSGILALKAKVTSYDGDTCTGTDSVYAEKLSFITIG